MTYYPPRLTVAKASGRLATSTSPRATVAGRASQRLHIAAVALGGALLALLLALSAMHPVLGPRAISPSILSPAIGGDFADPAVLVVGDDYFAYATNAAGKHVQVARSTDLRQWVMLPDALPHLPVWASAGGAYVWAPDVIQIGAQFVMYYTARDAAAGRQCIGVATSERPAGPFRDDSAQPLVCQRALGGDIDASPFRDGAALYLYFKSDGNCCHLQTTIWGQRLASDGLRLIGAPVALLTNDQAWEGDVVEAPNMLQHDGRYDLFYSGNDYASARYAIGFARCQTPLGPCQKPLDHPLLASDPTAPTPLIGPGGASLFQVGDATWIAFHIWMGGASGSVGGVRSTLIERLIWAGDIPEPLTTTVEQ